MDKKVVQWMERIKDYPGLEEDERYMFARSLAATPDQRWEWMQKTLHSLDLHTRSSRRKYGFKS
jgi:hypothetical protein